MPWQEVRKKMTKGQGKTTLNVCWEKSSGNAWVSDKGGRRQQPKVNERKTRHMGPCRSTEKGGRTGMAIKGVEKNRDKLR